MQQFRERNIVILTGAGISAESGLDTFRDPDGIWARYDYRRVATPEGFAENPALVHEFYNMRRRETAARAPNAAHLALARLEREWPGGFLLVTQNIDSLHEKAGSSRLRHMHGTLDGALCAGCGARFAQDGDMGTDTVCPSCMQAGQVRPDVVWFGEMPYFMEEIFDALSSADLFISIGTSGTVYPAAGFVREAREAGAWTVELNLEASGGFFDSVIEGRATETVPDFVDRLLARPRG
ncbi:NAD-dependent deacylase [Rhizobiaceae bacterium BDR2-2]|uniref:NAD-dependent protein deacylase n=1 Tax=Ectorhizobium quercum TaxID=2965071 RepID=A0AAE3N2H2_9HYPH|nr:NAD-dependent deacylase [Ectorhizobium quercum]MCX8998070.1 NAD-dependent deacylase [Ectorhizobium quercum]